MTTSEILALAMSGIALLVSLGALHIAERGRRHALWALGEAYQANRVLHDTFRLHRVIAGEPPAVADEPKVLH